MRLELGACHPFIVQTLVVQTYEGSTLVVEHRFFGETRERAEEIYHAHKRSDAFLRGCVERKAFGAIACSTRAFWLDSRPA